MAEKPSSFGGPTRDAMNDEADPWRAIFAEELRVWQSKSYDELRNELSDVAAQKTCCVHYEREQSGGTYQVEVQPLEFLPEYLHVFVAVFEPTGWRSISYDFIRHADGRLDGLDI